jgi:hypothetical protein
MMVEEALALIGRPPPRPRSEMNELTRRTSTSTWLPWREAVDRVARHLGYPPENARLRIVRKAKARPVRAHGQTAGGWAVGWSVSPVSVAGYAIDLDSGALGPPHFSGEVINEVKLCIDDMMAADLLPASGGPEGPVERAWWPAVEAAAYIIEWEDWGPGMHREAARSEIKLSEAIREGLPARGRKKPETRWSLYPPMTFVPIWWRRRISR